MHHGDTLYPGIWQRTLFCWISQVMQYFLCFFRMAFIMHDYDKLHEGSCLSSIYYTQALNVIFGNPTEIRAWQYICVEIFLNGHCSHHWTKENSFSIRCLRFHVSYGDCASFTMKSAKMTPFAGAQRRIQTKLPRRWANVKLTTSSKQDNCQSAVS